MIHKWYGEDLHNPSFLENSSFGSSLWRNIMQTGLTVLKCISCVVGKGSNVRFWLDMAQSRKFPESLP